MTRAPTDLTGRCGGNPRKDGAVRNEAANTKPLTDLPCHWEGLLFMGQGKERQEPNVPRSSGRRV